MHRGHDADADAAPRAVALGAGFEDGAVGVMWPQAERAAHELPMVMDPLRD